MESLQDGENGYIVFSVPNMEGGVNILFSGYCYKANEEGKEEIKTLDYTLERYDSNMELLTSEKIGDVFEFQNLALNQDNTYYASMWDSETGKQIICTLDEHFKKINEVATIHTNYSLNMIVLRDGSVYVMYPNNSSYLMECGKVNYNTGKIEKIEIEGMPQWTDQVFISESNDYDFYVYDSTSVYGLRPKDAVCEEVINWTNSDFIGEYVENLLQLSDGRFSLTYKDTVYNTHEVWILSPREKSDINIISLATLGLPDNLNFAVTRYNRSQNKNRIVIYDYGQFNTHENQYKGGLEKFKTDMTSGIVADIINTEGIPYESFCNKEIFTDLNEFMGDITDDRYFTNFFQSLAFSDKLYRVGFNFNISTILAKTEFVGSSSGKTLEEMYEIINNLPEGMDVYQEMSKTSILNSLISNNLEGFINRNTGICYFDSPEFVNLLEFCNLFDSTDNSKDWNNYLDERLYWYINDAVLFYPQHIYNLKESYQDRFIYFENSPVTMFGLPAVQEGDNGGRFETDFSLAICSESRLKNECWKFFESMLEDDFQMNMIGTLPVSKSAFDTLAQEQMIPKTYIDENGNEAIEENIYHIHTSTGGEREYSIPLMPQSYVDEIKTYISSVTYCTYYDEQVYNIIQEEAEKFFAGDQTAQQAADMIQKRSSLYLAEQG